jgi:hypothetical protein
VGRVDPVIRCPWLPDAVLRTHGCYGFYKLCRTKSVMSKLACSAGIDKGPVCGPQAHDDVHLCATGRTESRERFRGYALSRPEIDGVCLHDQQAEGGGRDGTAGMEKAEMTDFHEAIGQDVLEEPTEKFHDVEVGGAWARTARFTVGDGDGAVLERNDAAVGDGDLEDRGGAVCEGRVAVGVGLAVDVPVDVPDQWVDLCQQSSLVHIFFEARTVNG